MLRLKSMWRCMQVKLQRFCCFLVCGLDRTASSFCQAQTEDGPTKQTPDRMKVHGLYKMQVSTQPISQTGKGIQYSRQKDKGNT